MVYNSVSLQEIVGMIIRRTRLQDTSMIADLHVWIGEAMEQLGTTAELVFTEKDVAIRFHKAKIPCGTMVIDTLVWDGCRVRCGRGTTVRQSSSQDAFFVTGIKQENTVKGNYMYSSYATKIEDMPYHGTHWFEAERGHIVTSLPDGTARLFAQQYPTDIDGFPLIPDNGSYKMAIYYYVRAAMIEAGFVDRVFNHETLMARFEVACGRAKEEITYPAVHQMDRKVYNWLHAIPPDTDHYIKFIDP